MPVSDGNLNIWISVYDASSGGSCLYAMRGNCGAPTWKTVTVTNGVFSTLIGDTGSGDNAIPDELFDANTLYLGVTVASDTEMVPRKRISAAPYAFNADRLDDLDVTSSGSTTPYIVATTANGNLTITGNPQGSTVSAGSVYINPAGATANETLIGVADNGTSRWMIDKEGDITHAGSLLASAASSTSQFIFRGAASQSNNTFEVQTTSGGRMLGVSATGTQIMGGKTLTYDSVNGKLGINSLDPNFDDWDGSSALWVQGNGASEAVGIGLYSAHVNGLSPAILNFMASRGTVAAYDQVANGDRLGVINFAGLDDADNMQYGASIRGVVDGGVSAGSVPTQLQFRTGSGSNQTTRLIVDSSGLVTIGDIGGAARLTVSGSGTSPTSNIFEVGNGTLSQKYFTVSSTTTSVFGNLTITGTCTGCSGGAATLQTAYDSSTGTTEIFLGSAHGALTLADSFSSFNGNLFEIQNRTSGTGDYSQRYFTVSSTNTLIGGLTAAASSTHSITPNARIAGNLTPTTDATFDLGDYNRRWRDLWLSGGSANIAYDTSASSIMKLSIQTTTGYRGVLSTASNMPLQLRTTHSATDTNGIYIDTAGRVGIGTLNAYTAPLHVNRSMVNGVGGMIMISNRATATNGNTARLGFDVIGFEDEMSTATIDARLANAGTGATNMIFNVYDGSGNLDAYERVRIEGSSGFVGFGTTTPTDTVHIKRPGGLGGLTIQGNQADISFTSNTNTAGFLVGRSAGAANANDFFIYDAASALFRLVVGTTGNVGIGADPTATPDSLLDIFSSGAADTVVKIANTNAGNFDPSIGFELAEGTHTFTMGVDDSDADKFKISTTALGTNDRLVIDSTGLVGIGASSPANRLHVQGANATEWIRIESTVAGTAGSFDMYASGNGGFQQGTVGFNTGGAVATLFSTAGQEKMRISAAGHVGIGTSVPNAKLSVASATGGDIFLLHNTGAVPGGLGIWTASFVSSTSGNLDWRSEWDQYRIFLDTDNNSTEKFEILANGLPGGAPVSQFVVSTGNVGIGNAAPANRLTVGNATSTFEVDAGGNLVRVNAVPYSWPSTQGGASTVLTNNGSGVLSWSAGSGLTNLNQAYNNSTSSTEIFLTPSLGALTIADTVGDAIGNLFEIQDRTNSAGDYSRRYMTVSATSTLINPLSRVSDYRVGIGTMVGTPGGYLEINSSTITGINTGTPQLRLSVSDLSLNAAGVIQFANNNGVTAKIAAQILNHTSRVANIIFQTADNSGAAGDRMTIGATTTSITNDVTIDGSTTIGNASSTDTVIFNSRIGSNFTPTTDNAFDLGDYNRRWRDLWLSGGSAKIAYDTSATTIMKLGWNDTRGRRALIDTANQPFQVTPGGGSSGLYMDKFGRVGIGTDQLVAPGSGNTGSAFLQIDSASGTQRSLSITIPTTAVVNTFEIIDSGTVDVSVDRFGKFFALNTAAFKVLPGDTNMVFQVESGPFTSQFKPRNAGSTAVTISGTAGMTATENLLQFYDDSAGNAWSRFNRFGQLIFGATTTNETALITMATSTAATTILDIRDLNPRSSDYTQHYFTVSTTSTNVFGNLNVVGTCTGCGGGSTNLNQAYNASTGTPEITITPSKGGITISDTGAFYDDEQGIFRGLNGNLFEVIGADPNDGSTGFSFFDVSATSTRIGTPQVYFNNPNGSSVEFTNGGTIAGANISSLNGSNNITMANTNATIGFNSGGQFAFTDGGANTPGGTDLAFFQSSQTRGSGSSLLSLYDNLGSAAGSNLLEIFSAGTTGNGIDLDVDNFQAGNAFNISANGLTSGNAIRVVSTGTGLTTGSLLTLSTATTGAVATNGIVEFEATGNFTSTSNVGLLNLKANSTTAGTVANISGTALTTGIALNISAGGALTSGGGGLKVSTGGITSGSNTALVGGTSVTTGGALNITNWEFNHTTAETGSLVNVELFDASTNNTGASFSNAINILSHFTGTAGDGTRELTGVNVNAPTFGAGANCGSAGTGNCTWNGMRIGTPTKTEAGGSASPVFNGLKLVAGKLTTNAADTMTWNGLNFQMPDTNETSGGNITTTGIRLTGGVNTGGNASVYALTADDNAGGIGIGTTSPTGKLGIVSTALNESIISATGTSLVHGTLLRLYGGNAMKTGSVIDVATATFKHTNASVETGNAVNINFTNASDMTANSITNGINISSTVLPASSFFTRRVHGININPPTWTSECSTSGGNCFYDAIKLGTPTVTQGAATVTTIKGIDLSDTGLVGALTQSGEAGQILWRGVDIQMPSITQNSGTVRAVALRITTGGVTSGIASFIEAGTGANAFTVSGTGTITAVALPSLNNFAVCHSGANGAVTGALLSDCAGSASADYMEMYPAAAGLSMGDIVMPGATTIVASSGVVPQVVKTDAAYAGAMLGVISNPNDIGDFNSIGHEFDASDNPLPVALKGRVKVKVNMENGAIKVGDPITSSSVAGVGMKSTKPGMIVGQALEAWNGPGQGMILVFMGNGFHSGLAITTDGAASQFNDDFSFLPPAYATSAQTAVASRELSFIGSAWDGANAVAREISLKTEVTDASAYQFSFRNTDGNLLASLNQAGDLSIAGSLTVEGGFDYAEMFPAVPDIEAGDIVMVDPEDANGYGVKKTQTAYENSAIGVISTKPGFLTGSKNEEGSQPVALAGRVPVKVNMEGGEILPGDPITPSSTPGVGMKATEAGRVIGIALRGAAQDGLVMIFVNPSWWNGPMPVGGSMAEGTLAIAQDSLLDFKNSILSNVAAIISTNGSWSITSDGILTAEKVEVKDIETETMTVKQTDERAAIGEGVIHEGSTAVLITNPAMTPSSEVFVSFRGDPGGAYWVAERGEGNFSVHLAKPAIGELTFAYWIIDVDDTRTPSSSGNDEVPSSSSTPETAPQDSGTSTPETPVQESGTSTPETQPQS